MPEVATSFYQTGGTLRPDAPSYVERQADRDLYEGLTRGEFCYVLTPRQMGKSSLMARAAARLREQGVTILSLDLSAIGQNLSPEQWYDGLLRLIAWQLDLDKELEAFWLANERLGPLQRWMGALRQVILPRCPGQVVIAVDEIDAVRSLPFSTDEFFAAIRECYNRRGEDPEFARLTFCLLGVASPADLIRDTRTTPFNIGRRIELTDFTEAEAAPLAAGLGRKEPLRAALLQRVLYWTSGHPYLTQRLCQAVAEDTRVSDGAGMDRLCQMLFLSPQAREQDDNLLFVRDGLLRSPTDMAALLDLYGQVRRRQRVAPDETNPLVSHLRLSGIIRTVDRRLRLRNRIYERVFNREWITVHMPDAEVRRQRAAYRRGLLRATAVSGVILAVVASLALLTAWSEARATRLVRERQNALTASHRLLYAAQMGLAQQAWEDGNAGRAQDLLNGWQPADGQEDLRGFEWRYLWRLCNQALRFTFRGHTEPVTSVAFSPDRKTMATCSDDATIRFWDLPSRRETACLRGHTPYLHVLRFSPDGRLLASAAYEGTIRVLDVASRRELFQLKTREYLWSLAFSPDGKLLASSADGGNVRLWDLRSRRQVAMFKARARLRSLAFSPDGRLLAFGDGRVVRFWDVAARRPIGSLEGDGGEVTGLAISPDGKILAVGGNAAVRLIDLAGKRTLARLKGPSFTLSFSPDGTVLASATTKNRVRLWDVATKRERWTLKGHAQRILDLAFADNRTLASASDDRTVKLWDVAPSREIDILNGHRAAPDGVIAPDRVAYIYRPAGHRAAVISLAFSLDGRTLATGSRDDTVKLWDLVTGRPVVTLRSEIGPVVSIAVSPDGQTVACGREGGTVTVWGLPSRRVIATLRGHAGPVLALAFSPDGRILSSGDEGGPSTQGKVKLWETGTWRELTLREGLAHRLGAPSVVFVVSALAFSPDGRVLAAAQVEKKVRRWEVATQRELPPLEEQVGFLTSVRFSPDGTLLCAGSNQGAVNVWDPRSAREIAKLQGHSESVTCVAFSPDGKTFASGSSDGLVKLWNTLTLQEVATLRGHTRGVNSLAFSPDGSLLATGGEDATVRLWRAAPWAETDAPAGTRPHHASN
jgi:WD40 repeat protein